MGKFIEHFSGRNKCIDDTKQLFGTPVWVTFKRLNYYRGTISKGRIWMIEKLNNWESYIMWRGL
jgi:hypothetical protein